MILFATQLAESAGVPSQIILAKKQSTPSTGGNGQDIYRVNPCNVTLPATPLGNILDQVSGYWTDGVRVVANGVMSAQLAPSIKYGSTIMIPHFDAVSGTMWWGTTTACIYKGTYYVDGVEHEGYIYQTGKYPGYIPSEYQYADGGSTAVGGDTFAVCTLPESATTPGVATPRGTCSGGNAVTLTYWWPRWENLAGEFGAYEPLDGASGVRYFGLPVWTTGGGNIFTRSLEMVSDWRYLGYVTVGDHVYRNVTRQLIARYRYAWVLGEANSPWGWYQSDNEPSITDARTFVFQTKSEENKGWSFGDYLNGSITDSVRYDTDFSAVRIDGEEPSVTWWQADSTGISATVTMVEKVPDANGILQTTGNTITLSWLDVMNGTYGGVLPDWDVSNGVWKMGTSGEAGYYEQLGNVIDTDVEFMYSSVDREDIVLTFDAYIMGDNTTEVAVGNFEVWE